MNEIHSYRDLKVWQKAMDLVVDVYSASKQFPNHELYGLTSQVRRAGVSIASNIAEGHSNGLRKPFIRHLRIANGSLGETETQILIAERLDYLDHQLVTHITDQTCEIRRMLYGLQNSLERNQS